MRYLASWFCLGLAPIFADVTLRAGEPPGKRTDPLVHVKVLTAGPKHHFFGYYGITPWNASESHLACLETDFQDHLPEPDEPAAIGLVDTRSGAFRKVAETRAWNFQQGAMLHWNPLDPEHEILFNDRRDGDIVSVVLDVRSGRKRFLPRAISAVSHRGKYALSLTYGRLRRLRPVVGYMGATDPNPEVAAPEDDGVFLIDLATGKTELVVSIREVYERLVRDHADIRGLHMWFNHTVFSKDDTRFLFLARCNTPQGRRQAMFTANLDGSELREVVPFGLGVSHFDWRNDSQIIATFYWAGSRHKAHVLFSDGLRDYRRLGAGTFLDRDGHCTFGPHSDWLATDPGAPDGKARRLCIYNVATGEGHVLGEFALGEYRSGDLRCDLHPRWNRTGDVLCIDAIDPRDGTRQLHLVTRSR